MRIFPCGRFSFLSFVVPSLSFTFCRCGTLGAQGGMFYELLSGTRSVLRSAAACQSLRRHGNGRPCHSPAQHADATGAAAASAADEWAAACSAVGTRWRLAARQTRFQQGRIFGNTVRPVRQTDLLPRFAQRCDLLQAAQPGHLRILCARVL